MKLHELFEGNTTKPILNISVEGKKYNAESIYVSCYYSTKNNNVIFNMSDIRFRDVENTRMIDYRIVAGQNNTRNFFQNNTVEKLGKLVKDTINSTIDNQLLQLPKITKNLVSTAIKNALQQVIPYNIDIYVNPEAYVPYMVKNLEKVKIRIEKMINDYFNQCRKAGYTVDIPDNLDKNALIDSIIDGIELMDDGDPDFYRQLSLVIKDIIQGYTDDNAWAEYGIKISGKPKNIQ